MISEDLLRLVKRRSEEIIPEAELVKKLQHSEKTGTPLRIKYGIDPTGADVHIGHLVPIRKMRDFQDLGHIGVIIIGDFTARIGDPTGLDITRPPLTLETIKSNADRYMEQLYTVLDKDKTEVRWQSEWFDKMNLADVLQLLSKFTLARFLAHDTFRKRYDNSLPLSMHEIMYPVLQGYDSVAIKADVELGATEQKFNILVGRDMQQYFDMEQQVAMLFPILLGTDGVKKMGKSHNNYIAIFDSSKDKYGKVMSIPDELIFNYFELATNLSKEEIQELKNEMEQGANPKLIKQRLAREIVALYDGKDAVEAAEKEFENIFSKGDIPEDIEIYDADPSPVWIVKLLTDTGLCTTNGEARRMIRQNAVTIDKNPVRTEEEEIALTDGMIIKVGKRRFLKIRINK